MLRFGGRITSMKFRFKYLYWIVLLIVGGLSFFGFISLPKDWRSAMEWVTSVDSWLSKYAAHPSLFALFIGLVLGTVIVPECWRILKAHIAPYVPKPDMAIADAIDYIVN